MHPGDDVAPANDMRRPRKGSVGGRAFAALEGVGDVVAILVPYTRRTWFGCLGYQSCRSRKTSGAGSKN